MDNNLVNKRSYKQVLMKVIAWGLFLSLPLAFRSTEVPLVELASTAISLQYLFFCLTYIVLFLVIKRYLIPAFYFKEKPMWFTLSIVFMLVLIIIWRPYDRFIHSERQRHPGRELSNQAPSFRRGDYPPFKHPSPPMGPALDKEKQPVQHLDIISIYLFLTIVAGALTLSLTERWRESEQRVFKAETDRAHAEADKVNAELSFLKAQINPHFLFNTLNNIYSLAVIKSDKTADSVVKLSNIMRYLTEDASRDFITLEQELKSISNYIDLQRLRLSSKVETSFTVIGEPQGKSVPPLILMTFVENAFKYGVSKSAPYPITIRVSINENSISFYSENKISDNLKNIEQSSTRLGVSNTRKRLEYLYPGKYQLEINKEDLLYKVNLSISV